MSENTKEIAELRATLAAETTRADEEAKQHAGWKALALLSNTREAAARQEAEAERDALRAEIARLRASSAARQAPGDRADY